MGMIDKLLLLYLCISIAIAFWHPELVLDDGNSTIVTFFGNLSYNSTTNTPNQITCVGYSCLSNNINQQTQNQTVLEGIFAQMKGGTSYFIDALNNVVGFFKVLFNCLAAPILLFTNSKSPLHFADPAYSYFLALPLVVLLLIAFINWIRSGIT